MKQSVNWQKYVSLNQRKYAGQYVVIVAGKLVGAGKGLARLLAAARKKFPGQMPFVGRVRDPRRFCVY